MVQIVITKNQIKNKDKSIKVNANSFLVNLKKINFKKSNQKKNNQIIEIFFIVPTILILNIRILAIKNFLVNISIFKVICKKFNDKNNFIKILK